MLLIIRLVRGRNRSLLFRITYSHNSHDWLYSWLHSGCVTTAGEVYSFREHIYTPGFTRVSVLSWVWHLFPALLCLWTNDFRLTDERRVDLFPSLYIFPLLDLMYSIDLNLWGPNSSLLRLIDLISLMDILITSLKTKVPYITYDWHSLVYAHDYLYL